MDNDLEIAADWYESFFTGPANAFWERTVPAEATAADIAFADRHLDVVPPARILDMPCGAGRHALALAASGYEVIGVDLSEDAVSRAETAAREQRLPATFVRSDMRRFEATEPFDGAICFGNSISYFDADGTAGFFARLAQSLKHGARLVLDSYCCAESIFPLQRQRSLTFEGGSYEARMAYDPMRSRLCTIAELRLADEVHPLRYAHYVLGSGELVRLLRQVGLVTLGMYADTANAPFVAGSPRLLLVAARE